MATYNKLNQDDNYEKRLSRVEISLFGLEGENGLRSKVKEHDLFINQLKPQLQDLVHSAKSLEEIKTNIWRIMLILITSAIIAAGSKFIQIKTGNDTLNEIKTIQKDEIKVSKP